MLYSINVYVYSKKSLIFFLQTHIKHIIPYNYPNIDLNIKSEYFPYIATVFILPPANCYRNRVCLKCNGVLNYKLSLKYYKSSPLLAPRLQHVSKHAPLSLLTP